ncbi:MAG TPA: pantetheine-phosphate adenylyltransferase [Armatimonadota bacterium]
MRRGVYAGSFDPMTNGHCWMITQGATLFDELIVAIGENPDKRYLFSLDERLAMLREVVGEMPGVTVAAFEQQFLVNYAKSVEADFLLRGIRDGRDFEFERSMRYVNHDLDADISTVFLLPPREMVEISSNFVKGLIGPQGWPEVVRRYVPSPVYPRLLERFAYVSR